MKYDLECRYDTRNSFYGKAQIEKIVDGDKEEYLLYSYNTLVANIIKEAGRTTYNYFGKYSQTTTRHQKEFFRQFGLSDNELKELFKNGEYMEVY